MTDALDAVKENIRHLKEQKNSEYRSGMHDISTDKTQLAFDDIDKALNDSKKSSIYKGEIKNEKGHETYQKIRDEINNWKNLDPAEYHTPEGFDALKQKIGGIVDSLPHEEKTAKLVGNQVYNALKDTIGKQAPTYSKVMKQYADASEEIRNVEKTLSDNNGRASVDTAMRKLQSLTRNNVNTNYGNRLNLASQLEEQGGTPFLNQLAGQSLSSWTPRGLAKVGPYVVAGSAASNPLSLVALPLESPRLVGHGVYAGGRLAKGLSKVAPYLPPSPVQGVALSNLAPRKKDEE